jgi:RND family efflux transporter MFP subunit
MRHLCLALLALALLAGCDEEATATNPVTPVRVEIIAETMPVEPVAYSASIVAKTQVDVSFQVDGMIQSLRQVVGADGLERNIQQGDRVAEGDVLATVDPEQYQDSVDSAQASLASAQADLANARANWERTQNLYAEQSATATDYDNAKQQYESALASVNSAAAQLDSSRDDLSYTDLTAPMDGVVLTVDVEVGTLVSPQTTGFVLADTSSVKAVFGVPDTTLGDVSVGDTLGVTTASIPDTTFDGIVTSVAPSADSSTRLFQVEVTLPNPDGRLLVGMVASLRLDQGPGAGGVPTVPVDALVRGAGDPKGYAVFVLVPGAQDDTVRLTEVAIGQVLGNRIAITSGIAAGDRIVTVGMNTIVDGQQVRVVP